jgi:hypothetical protein
MTVSGAMDEKLALDVEGKHQATHTEDIQELSIEELQAEKRQDNDSRSQSSIP